MSARKGEEELDGVIPRAQEGGSFAADLVGELLREVAREVEAMVLDEFGEGACEATQLVLG